MTTRNVCVVGAGVAGLTSIKHCLENGLDPVCYEQDTDIGGLWNYREQPKDGWPSIYKSCRTITSKEMTCFSDFPVPKEFPNFMGHKHLKKYLDLYADKFNLRRHIEFQFKVEQIEITANGNRWKANYRNLKTGKLGSELFSFVMVCHGRLYKPRIPDFTGLSMFKGNVIHTHDYKTFHGYEGKKILVIGMGASGADIACEMSRHAQHVYISTRSGRYMRQRTADFGIPFDHLKFSRFNQSLPVGLTSTIIYHKLNFRCKHTNYGLAPSVKFIESQQTISDDLANRIIYGTISVVSNINEFTETGVILDDGLHIDNLDAVILATGYEIEFPFLNNAVIEMDKQFLNLYKTVFPVDNEHNNLAVIGFAVQRTPVPPVVEMQARWACSVFSRICLLPPPSERRLIVEKGRQSLIQTYGDQAFRKSKLGMSFIAYMDDLARMIGCKPNIMWYFLTNFRFAYTLYFGPATPPQWRLNEPGKWSGAAEAIENVERNTYYPMKTRNIGNKEKDGLYGAWPILVVIILVFIFFILYISVF